MDIRRFVTVKRKHTPSSDSSDEEASQSQPTLTATTSPAVEVGPSKSQKKKIYKSRLSYKREWEQKYPWLSCTNVEEGMFCTFCQKSGKSPVTARGAWTSRGVKDWNHATEVLKRHNQSTWHRDSIVFVRMAEQGEKQSVIQMQSAVVAKEQEEKRVRNRALLLKLLRSVYFLAKKRLPLTTVYGDLLELQVQNGDEFLKQHLDHGPHNAQYTSNFSIVMLLDAIDTWLDQRLIQSLKSSPYFTVLADECQDITSAEELSICGRWLVNGKPEEHFLTILHISAQDATTISGEICSYLESKNVEYHKLVGQGYDGAATFAGINNGVQKIIRTHAAHALYIHCACHRLQLASMQAADSIPVIKKVFGMMLNLWKLFYYSPKKAESLREVQSILKHPELKIVKPSSTRWLSHERCVRAICKELPALVITLQQLYENSGDAEAFGLSKLLSSFSGVASLMLLSKVLDTLARMNASMQMKAADFSKLPVLLKATTDQLKHMKEENSEWVSLVNEKICVLEQEHGIEMSRTFGSSRLSIQTMDDYRTKVAIPYIDKLLDNIKQRFSDDALKIVVAMSIFNPALLPTAEDPQLSSYGNEELKVLANFYGKEASVEHNGTRFTSPPLLNSEDLQTEWKIFRRAMTLERDGLMQSKELETIPSLQELLREMHSSSTYSGIFPEMMKLLNIMLTIPVGTATVERSFSQMKMIKTRLRNRLSDANLQHLMRVAIEGPDLKEVDFNQILDIFKLKSRRVLL